ncbi:unnamed protein product [Vicia faba]|uniref:Uncharacterized protein n=1 Tax=Vicia faba TaxID=3906 RepID=A0AAV1ACK9_VICFA|nr:unnamed protein product [Vicia faba]
MGREKKKNIEKIYTKFVVENPSIKHQYASPKDRLAISVLCLHCEPPLAIISSTVYLQVPERKRSKKAGSKLSHKRTLENQESFKRTSSQKGININKEMERFLEVEKKNKKEDGSSAHACVGGSHGGPSTRAIVSRKTSIMRMKTVKKKFVEESD